MTIGPGVGATAVFLGDSYTSGWNGAGMGERGWPRLVGSARGWRTVNLAVAGTGFLNPGWTDQPIGNHGRLPDDVRCSGSVCARHGDHTAARRASGPESLAR